VKPKEKYRKKLEGTRVNTVVLQVLSIRTVGWGRITFKLVLDQDERVVPGVPTQDVCNNRPDVRFGLLNLQIETKSVPRALAVVVFGHPGREVGRLVLPGNPKLGSFKASFWIRHPVPPTCARGASGNGR
jgi:hypothetical protein